MFKLFDAVRTLSFIGGLALCVIVPAESSSAAVIQILHRFRGGSDGEFPEAGLTADNTGALYGTTFGAPGGGPAGSHCNKGCGNIFDLLDGGGLTTRYFFKAGQDGAFPTGEVVVRKHTIYGTTEFGGGTACGGLGCGTAFTLPTRGGRPNVHQFCTGDFPNCTNGAFPHAGPIVDSVGNAYGTTTLGGTGNGLLCNNSFEGCGTVYMLAPDLKETVLYSFCSLPDCKDGAVPLGKLKRDGAGNVYGTTQFGGDFSGGTIFELQLLNGNYSYKLLYSFCKFAENTEGNVTTCPDGSVPEANLIADLAGNLYGTTTYGGTIECNFSRGCGVIFKLAADGTYSVLHAFRGGNDGAFPQAPLVADGAGNLYGTTEKGGGGPYCFNTQLGCGTVFALAADGTETVFYAFGSDKSERDGAQPEGALLLQDRFLYGATRIRGNLKCNCGTLFRINIRTGPPPGSWQSHGLPPRWVSGTDREQEQSSSGQ